MLLLEVTNLLILMSHLYRRKPRTSINIMIQSLWLGVFLYYWSKLLKMLMKSSKKVRPTTQEGRAFLPQQLSRESSFLRLGRSDQFVSMKGSLFRNLKKKSNISHFPLKAELNSKQTAKPSLKHFASFKMTPSKGFFLNKRKKKRP